MPMAAAPRAPAAAQVPAPNSAAAVPPAAGQAALAAPPAAELAPSSGASSGSKRGRDQLSGESSSESAGEEQQQEECEQEDGSCSKRQRTSCEVSIKQEKQRQRKTLAAADAAAALDSADISMVQQEAADRVAEQVKLMLLVDSGAEFKQCLQRFRDGLLPSLSRDHLAGVIAALYECHNLAVKEGWRRAEEQEGRAGQ